MATAGQTFVEANYSAMGHTGMGKIISALEVVTCSLIYLNNALKLALVPFFTA